MDRLAVDRWLKTELKLNKGVVFGKRTADFAAADRKSVYEVKLGARGVRELRDGVLQLAQVVGADPGIERGYLMIAIQRSSRSRTREEWASALAVLRQDVRERLRLVAVVEGKVVTEPGGADVEALAQPFARHVGGADRRGLDRRDAEQSHVRKVHGVRWKPVEVEKVLVHRWLTRAGPIATKELQAAVGCSYPVVREVVDRLSGRGILGRGRGRTVGLTKYRASDWSALLSAMSAVYPAQEFVDVTGHRGAVDALLARLRKRAPAHVALGGVPAARFWDPGLDLHGTPRVDLVVHLPEAGSAEGGEVAAERGDFVERLDPGLKPRDGGQRRGAVVLVVHPVRRRRALFAREEGAALPWASPVETIYHLNQMGLGAQADALVARLVGGSEGAR